MNLRTRRLCCYIVLSVGTLCPLGPEKNQTSSDASSNMKFIFAVERALCELDETGE